MHGKPPRPRPYGRKSITTPVLPFLLSHARPAYKALSRTPPPLSSARVQALPATGNPPLLSAILDTDVSRGSTVFPRARRYHRFRVLVMVFSDSSHPRPPSLSSHRSRC